MTRGEYVRLVAQIAVLKEIAEEYSGKTIDNIIVQMEARKKVEMAMYDEIKHNLKNEE